MIAKEFTIMVSKSPFDSRNAEQALAFCYAAIESGHNISQVFFYQSGVHNASCLLSPSSDEINMFDNWCALHEKHKVTLNVCVTAAARRGIIASNDSSDAQAQKGTNLHAPFYAVGLTAYFEALSDTTVAIQL